MQHGMVASAEEFEEFTASPSSISSLQLRLPDRVEVWLLIQSIKMSSNALPLTPALAC